MASKRLLKKKLKRIVYEVLDGGDYLIETGSKYADKADEMMDEAVDFYDETLKKINSAKLKKDFKEIGESVEKAAKDFTDKLNSLQ